MHSPLPEHYLIGPAGTGGQSLWRTEGLRDRAGRLTFGSAPGSLRTDTWRTTSG
jgi:hypothetical protein